MAAECLLEIGISNPDLGNPSERVDRVRARLVHVLEQGLLPVSQRVAAGSGRIT